MVTGPDPLPPRPRTSWGCAPSPKATRNRRFLHRLIRERQRQADAFLTALAFERAWHRGDVEELVHHLADDAELTFAEPFPDRGPVRGRQLHEVMGNLSEDVRIDVTRKQVTGNRTTWSVRTGSGDTAALGCAETEFRDNRIVRLRLGSVGPA